MPAMSETGTATDSTAPSPERPPTAILVNRCEVRLWSLAQEERLIAQSERLKAAEAELQRKIEERRRLKGK